MEKLLLEIKNIVKNYPLYDEVTYDEKENIIVKKKVIPVDKNRDRITELVRKLIQEDIK